jgi:O-antigen/teichoic acid export membrane protein
MSRLSKNILYNIIGQGLLIILSFVAVRYIFRGLGEDALGLIFFAAMMNALICLILERGISSTIVREVSGHIGTNQQYIHDLSRTASLLYWIFFLLLGVAIYRLAPVLVARWINLKNMDAVTATQVLQVLGVASLLALPKSLYVSLLCGLQRMEFNNAIDILTSVLQQSGTIVILLLGGHIFHVVYWFAACYGLGILMYLVVCAHFFSLRALLPGYNFQVIKTNLVFASNMMFISITGAILVYADKIIVSKMFPIAIFGYYAVAYSIANKGALITSAVSQAALPSFSAFFQKGKRTELTDQYHRLQDLLCYGIVPIFAAIPFVSLPLFTYLFNEEAAKLLLLPTALLCIGFYMNGTITVPYIFSLAVGKPGINARQHFYALFLTLPATVALVNYMGLVGAGLSLILFYVFSYFYAVPRYCRECLQMPLWLWYAKVLKVFGVIFLSFGLTWLVVAFSGAYGMASLVMAYLVGLLLFLIAAYCTIDDQLREYLKRFLRSLRRASVIGS